MNERQEIMLIEELLQAVVPLDKPPVVDIEELIPELDVTDDETVGGLDVETAPVVVDMG